MFNHCVTVFKAMDEEAVDRLEGRVYVGFLTTLFAEKTDLSIPYYTAVMRHLQAMDCVRQLKRGGGPSPSQWLLVQEPTIALFDATSGKAHTIRGMASQTKKARDQRTRDLQKRIDDLERTQAFILDQLRQANILKGGGPR